MSTKGKHLPPCVEPLTTLQAIVAFLRLAQRRWQPLALTIATATMISLSVSTYVDSKIDTTITTLRGSRFATNHAYLDAVFVSLEKLHALSAREQLLVLRETQQERISEELQMSTEYIHALMPTILISGVIQLGVFFLGVLMILLLILFIEADPVTCLSLLPRSARRLFLMQLIIILTSCMWIPLIGPLLSIIYLPRMILALPQTLFTDRSLISIIMDSLKKTKGWWSIILLRYFGIGLTLFMMSSLLVTLVQGLSLISIKLGTFVLVAGMMSILGTLASMLFLEGLSMEPQAIAPTLRASHSES